MGHNVDTVLWSKASVTIKCDCGAKFTGQSYRGEYNSMNETEALAKFRAHKQLQDRMAY